MIQNQVTMKHVALELGLSLLLKLQSSIKPNKMTMGEILYIILSIIEIDRENEKALRCGHKYY